METSPKEPLALNRLLIGGWAMYAVSFILPMMDRDFDWGYKAFTVCLQVSFDHDDILSAFVIWCHAVNLSNVIMIASPFILSRVNGRALAILLLIGGINNSRFLWWASDGLELQDVVDILMDFFPAYYVWLLSFFVTGIALWRTPTLRR
jgi:hypothetical protein